MISVQYNLGIIFGCLVLSSGCLEFVGAAGEACSANDLCQAGLACVGEQCVDRTVACEERCGDYGGVDCGGCSEPGAECAPGNTCRVPCADRDCGKDLGIECGSCGADSMCSNRGVCELICRGRCGTVAGLACGSCLSPSQVCVATQCVGGLDCTQRPEIPARPDLPQPLGKVRLSNTVSSVAPLCGGWIAYGTADTNAVVIENVLSEGISSTIQFAQTVTAVALDPTERVLWISLAPAGGLARLDLGDGSLRQTPFSVDADAQETRIFRHTGQRVVLVEYGQRSTSRVVSVDPQTLTVSADQRLPFTALSIRPVPGRDLMMVTTGTTVRRLVQTAAGMFEEQALLETQAYGMAVSADGQFFVTESRSLDELISEFSVDDLSRPVASYTMGGRTPSSLVYSRDGTWLATLGGHGEQIRVFNRATRTLVLESGEGYTCSRSPCGMKDLTLSPDGDLAYAIEELGARDIYVIRIPR